MKPIVRRLLVLVSGMSLLAWGLVPVGHAASPIVVAGFGYPAGLVRVADACPGGAAPDGVDLLYWKSGSDGFVAPLGTHATGRGFSGSSGGMAGFEVDVAKPRSLSSFTVATLHTAPETNGAGIDGYFLAAYDPSPNDFTAAYYFASVPLNATATDWQPWPNLAAVQLNWSYWDGATTQPGVFSGTVAQLATVAGTDGSGAKLAFELGCDGRDYFMDELRVTTATGTTTHDFEGARSRTYISATPSHHSDSLKRDIVRINLVYGQGHYLLGDATGIADGVLTDDFLAGTARLYRKPYGTSSYRWAGTKTYEPATYAHFRIEPGRQTRYQIRSLATATHEASTSRTLLVTVKRRVRVRAADTTIRRGQRIVLSGYILPRDRGVTVTFQRLSDGRWRNVATTRTGSRGRYTVGVRATTLGKKKVRVKIATAKGNVGTVSPSVTIVVKRAPAPSTTPYVPPTAPPPPDHDPDDIKARYVFHEISGDGTASALGKPRSSTAWSGSATITQTDD